MALGERLRDPSPTMIGKTSRMPLRIMIVDDHPVFRTGLVNLLSSEDDFEIVAAVPSGDAAVEALHAVPPHVVLLDLSMPGEGGFDTLARMRDARPGVKVVVLTSSESSLDVDHARAAGAAVECVSGLPLESTVTQGPSPSASSIVSSSISSR
jgi:DNA-binding NarL/FixJ family response regulator